MKEFTCIVCPRGCHLTVDDNNKVSGNFCIRGEKYALSEITNPTRMITTIVRVKNRKDTMVSVKTSEAVSKKLIFDILKELENISVNAPCHIGDVLIHNILDSGADIIITKEIE